MSYEHVKFLRQNQTSAERLLWVQQRAKRFGNVRFRRQHQVGPFIVDFYCHAAKVAIEIDGDSHDLPIDYDERRTEWLNRYGIEVIRFTNRDIRENLEGVVRAIELKVASANPSPTPSQREGK